MYAREGFSRAHFHVSFRWCGSVEHLFEVHCPGFHPLVSVRHELPMWVVDILAEPTGFTGKLLSN